MFWYSCVNSYFDSNCEYEIYIYIYINECTVVIRPEKTFTLQPHLDVICTSFYRRLFDDLKKSFHFSTKF